MVSILRSNQPIAWLIVPVSGLLWFFLSLWITDHTLGQLVTQAAGGLIVAALAHRIYVRYGFVERGDPALAWISMVLLLLLMPLETFGLALRSWTALFFFLAAADQILQVHRQASASGLQFRAAALAALSVFLEPLHIGLIAAMVIVLGISRPFIFREWAMMALGGGWIFILVFTFKTFYPELATLFFESDHMSPLASTSSPRWIAPRFTRLWLCILAAWGVVLMFREKSKISLRAQTTRWHLLLLFSLTILFAILILPTLDRLVAHAFPPNQFGGLDKLLAIGVAFGMVGSIPISQRRQGATEKKGALRMFVILGSLLILFMPLF